MTTSDDDSVATPHELRTAISNACRCAGFTYAELEAQTATGDFATARARMTRHVIGGLEECCDDD